MFANHPEIYNDNSYQRSQQTQPQIKQMIPKPLSEISDSKLNSMNSSSKDPSCSSIYHNHDQLKSSINSVSIFDEIYESSSSSYLNFDDSIEFNDFIDENGYDKKADQFDNEDEEEFMDSNGFFYPPWNYRIKNKLESTFTKFSKNLPDIEYEECWDPIMVSEYADELFNDLRDNEYKYGVDPISIKETQTEFTWDDRKSLVQWIIKLHYRFRMTLETLYLTVNIVDRFLSSKPVSSTKIELIGATALFIAAKYEEVHPPNMQQLIYCCGDKFDANTVREAESYIITTLNFELNFAGPLSFLRRISKADLYDFQIRTFAKYFLEITLMDHRFIGSPMSWLAVGATYISKKLIDPSSVWTDEHIFYGGYTEEQLKPLIPVIKECCTNYENHHKILYWKYSDKKYQKCSLYVQKFLSDDEMSFES